MREGLRERLRVGLLKEKENSGDMIVGVLEVSVLYTHTHIYIYIHTYIDEFYYVN